MPERLKEMFQTRKFEDDCTFYIKPFHPRNFQEKLLYLNHLIIALNEEGKIKVFSNIDLKDDRSSNDCQLSIC